jgi:hypothetical protein
MNLATKSPLVCEVTGSNRKVFWMLPLLQGQLSAESILSSSGGGGYTSNMKEPLYK